MSMTRFAAGVALALGLSGASLATASTIVKTQVSGPYRLVLQVGAAEQMNMNGSSDQMLSGRAAACTMGGMAGMSMPRKKEPACNRHLELHVYAKGSSKVITTHRVTIQLIGGSKTSTFLIPIMTMQNAKIGHSDLHYGNNIYAPAGNYTVKVQVNGVRATFAGVRL